MSHDDRIAAETLEPRHRRAPQPAPSPGPDLSVLIGRAIRPSTCWQPPTEVEISSVALKTGRPRRPGTSRRRWCCIRGFSEASIAVAEARLDTRGELAPSWCDSVIGTAGNALEPAPRHFAARAQDWQSTTADIQPRPRSCACCRIAIISRTSPARDRASQRSHPQSRYPLVDLKTCSGAGCRVRIVIGIVVRTALSPPSFKVNVSLKRIASPEMLPSVGLLPHVICSPPGFGGGEHEADQHGDTG